MLYLNISSARAGDSKQSLSGGYIINEASLQASQLFPVS
jgi:hypothetical protein